MSTEIDEKVVEMRFDNKQFESGVQKSLSTIDKLKKELNFEKAAKGFDELSKASKRCDFSVLNKSIDAVSSKFSALETMAVGALLKIGNQAVVAGERIVKALTLDPITTGFNEYELKMGSIQTIMASTGESLDRVNQKLDELNRYADRTIYSFSDMTSNIGKFTNAGVKLDTAVAAIQGVSNVAAVSGANANEASRAMYNFAQALSAGYVKLIDWKSIENANMATVEFKNQLLESAVAAGTLTRTADGMYRTLSKKTVIDATHMFNDSLQEQWMTTEVLINTLNDYADETTEIGKKAFAAAQDVKTWTQLFDTLKESAQSGWAETWQLIIGDYEEAKTTLRAFSDFFSGIIDSSADTRNSLIQGALQSSWGQLKDRINETGISIDDFRETLRETAEASVDGLSEMIEEAGSFDATLSKGWLSTDMLSESLDNLVYKSLKAKTDISKLSDAQLKNAGYTEQQIEAMRALSKEAETAISEKTSISLLSDELLKSIGYTEEQIDALRTLSEESKNSDSNVSALVDTMSRSSGRELLFDSLLNGAKAIQGLVKIAKDAWREIFPATTSERIYSIIEAIHKASQIISDFFNQTEDGVSKISKPLQDIKSAFKGVFAVIDIVKEAFSALFRVIAPAKSVAGGLLSRILDISGAFGEWLTNLDKTIKENDTFYKVLKTIVDYIKNGIAAIEAFVEAVREKLHFPTLLEAKENIRDFISLVKEKIATPGFDLLKSIFENISTRAKQVRDAVSDMKNGIINSFDKIDDAVSGNKFVSFLVGVWNLVKKVGSVISNVLGGLFTKLIDVISHANFDGILDFLHTLIAGGFVVGIKKFLDAGNKLTDSIGGFFDGVKDFGKGVTSILDGVRGCLEAWQQNLKASILLKIAGAIGILAAALLVLSTIDSEKLQNSLAAITTLFVELIGAMAILNKLGMDSKGASKLSTAMIKMGAALLILSVALKNLANLEPKQLVTGLVGIGVLLAEIAIFLRTVKFDKGASKTATAMILFAAAIKILASAVKGLSALSWEDMAKGLIGVGVLLAEVDIFLNTAKFGGKTVLTATGIVILSAAIKVLASAVKDFGGMSWGEIAKGLASIGALLLEITAFTRLTGDAKHVVATGLALIEIGAAMKIIANVMRSFGSMQWEEIAKGLVALGGALAEIAISVKLMPNNMVGIGVGLIAVGAALKIIANVLGDLGGMSWEEIAKGLVALGGALTELSIALNLIGGTLKGSAALLVAAGAIAVLTPSLKALGGMSWESIAKGLVTIAGAFAVIGVAAAILSPLTTSILALSAALALIGVGAVGVGAGLVLVGAGLSAVSVGLVSLATALAVSATAIVAGLTTIILGIYDLIPAIAEQIGNAILAFCGVITEGAPVIAEAVKAVVLSLIDVLVTCIPVIADGALQLVVGVLDALVTYTPQIIDRIMLFLVGVLEGIARNIPQLIQAAMEVVGAFFSGILSALGQIDVDTLIKGIGAVGLLTGLMAALALVSGMIPAAMVGVLGLGVIVTELALVLAAIGGLAQIPGLEWLISEGGSLLETVGTAIGGFVGGIVGGFMSGVSSSFPKIGEDLSNFMTNVQPFIDGASGITSDLLTGISNLTGAILLITASDLLTSLTSWLTGGSSLADFGEELVPFGESMVAFSNSLSGLDSDLVTKAATAGKTLAEMASTLPTTGGVFGFFAGNNDMDAFGLQLVTFGVALTTFGLVTKGLDAEAVQNAAIAGKTMAEMAATLPNTGGVVSFFTGDNDMVSFGEQLVPFGKAIKEYSEAVSGLDVDAVVNSTTAGDALVALANTVPNTDGVVAFFTGDNDLSAFGEQLIDFGWAMSEYSEAISGIDSDAIVNSATAGAALVELADTIPNTGGLMSLFTGNNDIGAFGEQLVPFGEAMKKYSDSLAGFDQESVVSSAIAGQMLATLATTIPNTGGLVSLFTGDNDLASFAEGLIPFGKAMKDYGESVDGFENYLTSIEASITAGKRFVEFANMLPNSKGLAGAFSGREDLASFGDDIVAFADDLLTYAGLVAEVKPDVVDISAEIVRSLSDLATNLADRELAEFGTALKTLANHGLTDFVYIFSNSGAEIDEAVNDMLREFETSIVDHKSYAVDGMQVVMSDLLDEVDLKTVPIVDRVVEMMTDISDVIRSNSENIRRSISFVMNGARESADEYVDEFYNVGVSIAQGLINGIRSKQSAAASAGSDLGLATLKAAKKALDSNSPSVEFIELGKDIASGLKIGIDRNSPGPISSIEALSDKLISSAEVDFDDVWAKFNDTDLVNETNAVNQLSQSYNNATKAKGNYNKVSQKTNDLPTDNRVYYTGYSSEQYKHLMENLGEGLSVAFRNGIIKNEEDIEDSVREVTKIAGKGIDAWKDWLDNKKYYNKISLQEELKGWERLQQDYEEGTKERQEIDREVYRVQNELASEYYQGVIKWIEEEEYYNRINTKQEMAIYQDLQKMYREGSEERMEIDKKVYALHNQLAEESYQHSMNWIEREKYYNRLTLAEELAAYKRVQSRYKVGTEQREKMDREVYRIEKEMYDAQKQFISDVQNLQEETNQKRLDLEKEYADKVKEIEEKLVQDIAAENNRYLDALESRTDALYSSYGLFDEVAEKEEVDSDTLMRNLEDQVIEFGEWRDTLDNLAKRGVGDEFIEELQAMGPGSIAQIKALQSMTDNELQKYVNLWGIKHAQARSKAVNELEGLRIETLQNIEQLKIDADDELSEYRDDWQYRMDEVNRNSEKALKDLQQTFAEKIGLIKKNTEQEMQEMVDNATAILREAGWDEVGQQMVDSLGYGIDSATPSFIEKITQMALAGAQAAVDALSNSEAVEEAVTTSSSGVGTKLITKAVQSVAERVGSEIGGVPIETAISSVMQKIAPRFAKDVEFQPTVRPVMDLSNVNAGVGTVDGILDNRRMLAQVGDTSYAFSANNEGNNLTVNVDNEGVIKELRSLRGDMAEMNENITQMQVVLDTGATVGALAGPMDEALGERAVYSRRIRGI